MSPIDPALHRSFAGMRYALIEPRRFDEAIVAGKKALRQNPSYSATYRCLASAFAHLGRDAEADEAAALSAGLILDQNDRFQFASRRVPILWI